MPAQAFALKMIKDPKVAREELDRLKIQAQFTRDELSELHWATFPGGLSGYTVGSRLRVRSYTVNGKMTHFHLTPSASFDGAVEQHPEQLKEHGSESPGIIIRVDGNRHSVQVWNDGVAWIPFFYGVAPCDQLVLSTSLAYLVMLGQPPRLDDEGAIEYLVFKHSLAPRTILHGVSRLAPGSILEWTPSYPFKVRSASLFHPVPNELFRNAPEAIDAFRAAWSGTCFELAKIAGERAVIGLSGGFDSRAIATGLKQCGHLFPTISYSAEYDVARMVAKRLGLSIERIDLNANSEFNMPEAAASLNGAQSAFEIFAELGIPAYMDRYDTLIEGLGAEPAFGNVSYAKDAPIENLATLIALRFKSEICALSSLLVESKRDLTLARFREALDASTASLAYLGSYDSAIVWNFENNQIQCFFHNQNLFWRRNMGYHAPFFAKGILEFSARLPAELRRNGYLYHLVYLNVFPETAGIRHATRKPPPRLLVKGFYSRQGLGPQALWDAFVAVPTVHKPQTLYHFPAHWAYKIRAKLFPGIGETSVQDSMKNCAHFRSEALSFLHCADESLPAWLNPDIFSSEVRGVNNGKNTIDILFLGKVATLAYWSGLFKRVGKARNGIEKNAG